jgi:hypothetical protein
MAEWTNKTLQVLIKKYITSPNSLQYRELKGKTDPKAIAMHAEMLKEIKDKNFLMNKKMLSNALVKHFDNMKWNDKVNKETWVKSLGLRIKAICRDASQALGKTPRSAWVAQIFGTIDGKAAKAGKKNKGVQGKSKGDEDPSGNEEEEGEDEEEEEEEEQEEEEAEEEQEAQEDEEEEEEAEEAPRKKAKRPAASAAFGFYTGFEPETAKAFRVDPSDESETKEWAIGEPYEPKNALPEDLMLAEFKNKSGGQDTCVEQLTGYTCKQYKERKASMAGKGCIGHHKKTGLPICVVKRADRKGIYILKHGNEQKLQIREDAVDEPLKFMTEIAKDFSNDKIKEADLYDERDKRLKERGASVTASRSRAGPKKKPAAKTPNQSKSGMGKTGKKGKKGKKAEDKTHANDIDDKTQEADKKQEVNETQEDDKKQDVNDINGPGESIWQQVIKLENDLQRTAARLFYVLF